MIFQTKQIQGKGRGKTLGFPTINMEIPADISLPYGIYAANVEIENHFFLGALHYGPIPTFGENKESLEVFLIDANTVESLNTESIQISIIKRIRDIKSFSSSEALMAQIHKDVLAIRRISSPVSAE